MTLTTVDEDLQWIVQFGIRDFRPVIDYRQDRYLVPGEFLVCRIYPREEKPPVVDDYQSDPYRAAKVALSVLWITPDIKLAFGHGCEYYFVLESRSDSESITEKTTTLFGLYVNLWTREFFKIHDEMRSKPNSARSWAYENWVFPNGEWAQEFISSAAKRCQTKILIEEIKDEIDDVLSEHLESFPREELQTMYANMKGEHPSEMKAFIWFGTMILRSVDSAKQRNKVESFKAGNEAAALVVPLRVGMSLEEFQTEEIHLTDDGDIIVMHVDVTDEACWTRTINQFSCH